MYGSTPPPGVKGRVIIFDESRTRGGARLSEILCALMLSRPAAVANCFATEATVTGLNSTATSEINDSDQLLTPGKDIATRLPTEVKCLLTILAICREHKRE